LGADVDMVRKGMGTDTRIGNRFLFPGIGYGGSCFPKDVKALVKSSKDVSYNFQILNAVEEVNESQKTYLVPRIKSVFNNDLTGKHFAVWGLAFKPNTDDIREAPDLYIMEELIKAGATVTAFDPEAMDNVKLVLGDKINYSDNMYDALANADALIIATEWAEFRNPNFDRIGAGLKQKVIFDGRNVFSVEKMDQLGYHYVSIGRQTVNK
jgi:UDPglucose 6-dehydrogenase